MKYGVEVTLRVVEDSKERVLEFLEKLSAFLRSEAKDYNVVKFLADYMQLEDKLKEVINILKELKKEESEEREVE